MKDLTLANIRAAVHAARDEARWFLAPQEGCDNGARAVLGRKWRRVQHARHEQCIERLRALRYARREEARFLGDR